MQRNSPRAFRRSEFGVIPQQQRDAARVPRWGRRRGEDLVDVANAAARGHRIALGVDERGILSGGGSIDTAHRRRRREMLKLSVIVGLAAAAAAAAAAAQHCAVASRNLLGMLHVTLLSHHVTIRSDDDLMMEDDVTIQ